MPSQELVWANDQIETSLVHTKTQPAASLILVNYNGLADIIRCLESIYNHLDDPDDLQVVVVDNGSTQSGIEELAEKYPAVLFVRSEVNLGFAQGCNLGERNASAPVLVFLNPDTIVSAGWLDALLEPLSRDPQIGLVTSKIMLLSEPDRLNTAANEIHISGLTLCRGAGLSDQSLSDSVEVTAVSGAAFAIRRTLFENLGGFDPDFFMYMEDTDLSWRARLAGYRCWYAPASRIYHDYTLRFRQNKTYYQERNRYLMLLKNLHWGSLALLLPVLLLAELVVWGYILRYEPRQWLDKFRAVGWIASHWKLVLEKRHQAQSLRLVKDREILKMHTTRLDFEQTASGRMVRPAHWCFDPLFYLFGKLALALIRW